MSLKIKADVIIDGIGTVHENSCICVENGKITYFGSENAAPKMLKTLSCHTLMPGMWEAHGHFSGMSTPNIEETIFLNPVTAGAKCVWDLKEVLRSGITSVREVGGLGLHLDKAIKDGNVIGPNIYAAGKVLSTTGGHGDIHGIPLGALKHFEATSFGRNTDGISECLKGVREQLRHGAQIIKICASGGVMSEIDDPIHQQFSLEEIKTIVEEAKRSEVSVAAHCHGAAGIKVAIEGGCKTIEHGTYLTEELADKMKENDVILIPTRYVVDKLSTVLDADSVPEYVRKKAATLIDTHEKAVKLAIKKGVKIAMGTDIFTSGPNGFLKYGENAKELLFLTEYGLTPMEAIVAATSMGPETLGARKPKSGQIKVGYDADLLLLSKNPLNDISILTKRENISVVIKAGKVVNFD